MSDEIDKQALILTFVVAVILALAVFGAIELGIKIAEWWLT